MKKILTILVGLLIIVAIAIVYMFDTLGKQYAQEYAQKLLKTPVVIGQFNSSILDKNLNIDFIEVQNPPSFKNKNALSLDHFSVKVGEISDDLIVIDALTFEGLTFALEQNKTQVNLTQLFANLEQKSPATTESKNDSDESNQHIKIKQFKVNNINLKIDTKWLKTTLKVPNISVRNFGGESGAKLDDIGKQIAKEVLQALKRALEKEGIEAGKKKIEQSLRRKIEQKLGIENGIDTKKLENKAKELFKGFGF
jgi:hypothetical protein